MSRLKEPLRGIYVRKDHLLTKLLRNPFLPILFIGEFIKRITIALVNTGNVITPTTTAFFVLAIGSTVVWTFAEHLLDEAEETYGQLDKLLKQ